jgi:hypothetical protein
VEVEGPHSRPAVHRKEFGWAVVGHSHLAAVHIVLGLGEAVHIVLGLGEAVHIVLGLGEAVHIVLDLGEAVHIVLGLGEAVHIVLDLGEADHIVLDLEAAVHIVLDLEEAVHTYPAADHSLAGEVHHSLLEVHRRGHRDLPGVVVDLLFFHPSYRKMNR